MAVEGFVDGVRERFVVGWAFDRDDPSSRQELEVAVDGRAQGTCVAEFERPDLGPAGIGDGKHAFRFEVEEAFEPGSEHLISVRARKDGTLLPLVSNYFAAVKASDGTEGRIVLRSPVPRPETVQRRPDDGSSVQPSTPSAPPRALVGRSGWLFDLAELEPLLRLLGRRPCSAETVEAVARQLSGEHEHLRELQVPYVVATLPDKACVYDDLLPEPLALRLEQRPVEHVMSALLDTQTGDLLDLLRPLRVARRHGEAFLSRGSGLTWPGAFHAYRAIARELGKRRADFTPRPVDALEFASPGVSDDPLPTRQRVALVGEELVDLAPGFEAAEEEPQPRAGHLAAMYSPVPDSIDRLAMARVSLLEHPQPEGKPTALVVHDGRAARVASFLAEHCRRTIVVVAEHLPLEVLEHEAVDVVVRVIDESRLALEPPSV
jgi:hypothetical protein